MKFDLIISVNVVSNRTPSVIVITIKISMMASMVTSMVTSMMTATVMMTTAFKEARAKTDSAKADSNPHDPRSFPPVRVLSLLAVLSASEYVRPLTIIFFTLHSLFAYAILITMHGIVCLCLFPGLFSSISVRLGNVTVIVSLNFVVQAIDLIRLSNVVGLILVLELLKRVEIFLLLRDLLCKDK